MDINTVLVSAGDAITAKLVEEAGFDGIWVSGFEVSARMGIDDNGSLTMTEMLNVVKPIVDSVKIPVYVDCDTGYGNTARTVWEFQKIGVTGICIEDVALSYKRNSLWGDKIPLMDIETFALNFTLKRKIKMIARTEALIRGYGFEEAAMRADIYLQYGADYILVHTRDKTGGECMRIADKFKDKPLVIVPTKFPEFTNDMLFKLGYNMVIWANQTERVKIKAIRGALETLKINGNAKIIEKKLSASLDDMKGLTPNG